jgi:hypothetical protein
LAIWIIAGSTVDRLLFGVSYSQGDTVSVSVYSLSVEECYLPDTASTRVYWRLQYAGYGGPPKFRELEYGRAPRTYRPQVGPKPLKRGACYYALLQKSKSGYPQAWATFLTDSVGAVAPIDGFALEKLKWPGSTPEVLPDSARSTVVAGDGPMVATAVQQTLTGHGFVISHADPPLISTQQLRLGRDWERHDVAERIDCGRWVEGGNRVRLPLSRDSAGGYGHMLVKLNIRLVRQASATFVSLEPEVWMNPPWFEQGDRPMMPCTIRESFVEQLLQEIIHRAQSPEGGG